nr:MAG TPA: hypothetical protein [Caudoviricetes sp.]
MFVFSYLASLLFKTFCCIIWLSNQEKLLTRYVLNSIFFQLNSMKRALNKILNLLCNGITINFIIIKGNNNTIHKD